MKLEHKWENDAKSSTAILYKLNKSEIYRAGR